MSWKFLSLQRWLDALFDDAWYQLGVPEGLSMADSEETQSWCAVAP